jgi:hypothetical protein
MPEESDWILFAPYNDKSLMRDVLAYKLANDMGHYASRSKFCEVVLNGEYIGVYVLLEKVKRDKGRVDIKKLDPSVISGDSLTGGYIIKIDKPDGENNGGWYSPYLPFNNTSRKIYYQYHYPKPDDIVLQQMDYIKNIIFNFESLMKYGINISDQETGYPKYIDVSSFVDYVILNEFAKNVDAYRLSTYLYKDRDSRNTKLFAGPVWDFNLAFGNANYYEGGIYSGWYIEHITTFSNIPSDEPYLTPSWWRRLFDDSYFRDRMYARWEELKTNVLSSQHFNNYVDSLVLLLEESRIRNFEKWPVIGKWVWPNYFVGQTYSSEIEYLKNWTANRIHWINNNMVGGPSSIEDSDNEFPSEFFLDQNYPNPFNASTQIKFTLPVESDVKLTIYNLLGNKVEVIFNGRRTAGTYNINWNAGNLPSGVYFCQLKSVANVKLIKMILMK